MYTGHSLTISASGSFAHLGTDGNWKNFDDQARIKVMQFTGLLDCRGNEIWEGDTVKILYSDWPSQSYNDSRTLDQYLDEIALNGIVVFFEDRWCIEFPPGCHASIMPGDHGFIRVTGNIYEPSPTTTTIANK
jgi:hypothetical protein